MIAVHWFRRDLRLSDNAALFHALKSGKKVLPIFIFDKDILEKLENKNDARVSFIYQQINNLQHELAALGSSIWVYHGSVLEAFKLLTQTFSIGEVYTNEDYESYAIKRDNLVKDFLLSQNIAFKTFKDQVVFDGSEILKADGTPYVVYTPFSKVWKSKMIESPIQSFSNSSHFNAFLPLAPITIPSLAQMGFTKSELTFPLATVNNSTIKNYEHDRDFPFKLGTSRLGLHFRFGTISIREKAQKAAIVSEKWLNELIWRDFYSSILYHFPHVEKNSFRPQYDQIEWRNNETEFEAWKKGKTGYPIVDAGMRELNATGFMHNRVRMVVASFLTKHLLIDWRWGEAYFAEKLLDFDLASNNGGWQWAAGSGVDAAPYFRVFNPTLQQQKFDPQNIYIKKWVREWGTYAYPKPIVEHALARERCLATYKKALTPS
jgi:deoxyribodipyrimidine photo-lyase